MTDLRVMKIPENRMGLTAGWWLRWSELRMFLVERDEVELANLIEEQMTGPEPLSVREITVRR